MTLVSHNRQVQASALSRNNRPSIQSHQLLKSTLLVHSSQRLQNCYFSLLFFNGENTTKVVSAQQSGLSPAWGEGGTPFSFQIPPPSPTCTWLKIAVLVSKYLHLINSNETEYSALRSCGNSYSTNFK